MARDERVDLMRDQSHLIQCSPKYRNFWELRCAGLPIDTYNPPTTEDQLAEATRLTTIIISLLGDPEFAEMRDPLKAHSTLLIRNGKISEENHMEIIRTYERMTEGSTTEEFVESLGQ